MEYIPKSALDKINMRTFEDFCEAHPNEEAVYWQTFLTHTDYITNKIVEANYLGEELSNDYAEILEARKLCRQKINELQSK